MNRGFGTFVSNVDEAVRRGLLELKRLIERLGAEKVDRVGDTMTGGLVVDLVDQATGDVGTVGLEVAPTSVNLATGGAIKLDGAGSNSDLLLGNYSGQLRLASSPTALVGGKQLAVTEAGTYTPTLVGMAVGTGGSATNTAIYRWVGGSNVGDEGLLYVSGSIIFGTSGTTFPTMPDVLLPSGFRISSGLPVVQRIQSVHFLIAAVGFVFGYVEFQASANDRIRFGWLNAAGTPLGLGAISPTSPGNWAAGDSMRYGLVLPAVRV